MTRSELNRPTRQVRLSVFDSAQGAIEVIVFLNKDHDEALRCRLASMLVSVSVVSADLCDMDPESIQLIGDNRSTLYACYRSHGGSVNPMLTVRSLVETGLYNLGFNADFGIS